MDEKPANPLVGTWALEGMHKLTDSGALEPPAPGWEDAKGFLIYTDDGRMMGVMARNGRQAIGYPDIDDAKRAEAHKTMMAYTGRYVFHGDHVLHHVDISWIPEWENADQRREVALDGDRLTLTTPFGRRADGTMSRMALAWQRVR